MHRSTLGKATAVAFGASHLVDLVLNANGIPSPLHPLQVLVMTFSFGSTFWLARTLVTASASTPPSEVLDYILAYLAISSMTSGLTTIDGWVGPEESAVELGDGFVMAMSVMSGLMFAHSKGIFGQVYRFMFAVTAAAFGTVAILGMLEIALPKDVADILMLVTYGSFLLCFGPGAYFAWQRHDGSSHALAARSSASTSARTTLSGVATPAFPTPAL